jgi:DNA-binding MarR family transcriptional regulator
MELERSAGLSQTELGTRLRLEKSTVCRLVKQLEQRGWVRPERDPTDRRAVQLRLTEAGRQAAGQIAAARAEKFARIAAEIPDAEQENVWSALEILVDAMNRTKRG